VRATEFISRYRCWNPSSGCHSKKPSGVSGRSSVICHTKPVTAVPWIHGATSSQIFSRPSVRRQSRTSWSSVQHSAVRARPTIVERMQSAPGARFQESLTPTPYPPPQRSPLIASRRGQNRVKASRDEIRPLWFVATHRGAEVRQPARISVPRSDDGKATARCCLSDRARHVRN